MVKNIQISVYRSVRTAPKAPLCKGGCQKSLIFDWGIVFFFNPSVQNQKILDTSPYTGEARASRSISPLNSN